MTCRASENRCRDRNRMDPRNRKAEFALASSFALLGLAITASAQGAVLHMLSVKVSPSPLAWRTLSKAGEHITVSASFYGDPSRAGRSHVDQVGRIALVRREQMLPATGGVARFRLADIPPPRLRWIVGTIRVNVNVYSSRRHFRDNVLACDFVDGPVPDAEQKPISLRCGLIRERPKTQAIS